MWQCHTKIDWNNRRLNCHLNVKYRKLFNIEMLERESIWRYFMFDWFHKKPGVSTWFRLISTSIMSHFMKLKKKKFPPVFCTLTGITSNIHTHIKMFDSINYRLRCHIMSHLDTIQANNLPIYYYLMFVRYILHQWMLNNNKTG